MSINKINNMVLKVGDTFKDLVVTKVTDKYAFFGRDKKLTWAAISKLILLGEKAYHYKSPNRQIDWTNKEDVLDFYNSFQIWDIGHNNSSTCVLADTPLLVENNLVLYKNEYYLPYPFDKYIKEERVYQEGFKAEDISDGIYKIRLYKKSVNTGDIYKHGKVNLFEAKQMPTIITDIKKLKAVKERIKAYNYVHRTDTPILFKQKAWDSIEVILFKFDPLLFFREHYKPVGDNVCSRITDKEIMDVMLPIVDEITIILEYALRSGEFVMDYSDDYGTIYIYSPLYFWESVEREIFLLIDNNLNEL
jgi:hypothetical protein